MLAARARAVLRCAEGRFRIAEVRMCGDWTLPLQRRTFNGTVPPDVKGLP
jgi:hypothetical protein